METEDCPMPCDCGANFAMIDREGHSATWQCEKCRCCLFTSDDPNRSFTVWIPQFQLKRGSGVGQRPIDDHSMAKSLIQRLDRYVAPTPAMEIEYGIDTYTHFVALRFAVQAGITAYDLDRVAGDGPAITCLVQSVPDQPFYIKYETIWDTDNWI